MGYRGADAQYSLEPLKPVPVLETDDFNVYDLVGRVYDVMWLLV